MPSSGSIGSTGASDPNASTAPVRRSVLHGYARADARCAPVAVREVAVARGVDRLHRCDDAERTEAREVVGANELHVLDLLPQLRGARPRRLDRVERDVHRTIADGVDRDGDARRRGGGDILRELSGIDGEDAAVA